MPLSSDRVAKQPSVLRLPAYLRIIKGLHAEGVESVSTTHLSEALDLLPIIVRKDLSVTGIVGRPRIGYNVAELIAAIEGHLGWDRISEAVLVGVGHLGTALLGFRRFAEYGLHIRAAFDVDPEKIGTEVHGCPVFSLAEMEEWLAANQAKMAVLTVPEPFAQSVAERLVAGGIRGIWNFSPTKLMLPDNVVAHHEDITAGLGVLSLKLRLLDETKQK